MGTRGRACNLEQEESEVFGKDQWNTCTGKEKKKPETHMHVHLLFPKPCNRLWTSKKLPLESPEYFGCKFSWNAELMLRSSTLQPASAVNPMLRLLCWACYRNNIWRYGFSAMPLLTNNSFHYIKFPISYYIGHKTRNFDTVLCMWDISF